MSSKYAMVKRWYENNRPIEWIKNAVVKGYITAEEYEEITGQKYE